MSEGNQENGGITREEFEEVVGEVRDLREENQQLRSKVAELGSRLADAETELRNNEAQIQSNSDDIQDNTATIEAETADVATDGGVSDIPIEFRGDRDMDNIWIGDFPIGKLVESNNTRVKSVASEVEEIRDGGGTVEADPEDRVSDDYTPVERIVALGEDLAESASDKRAVTIFENLSDWGKKTPNGKLIIRTGKDKLKTHLDAARPDDDVASWKQVHRACEALEDLSDGYISFREVKGNNALVVEEPTPSMTASSEA